MLSKSSANKIAEKYYKDIYLFCLSKTSANEAEDITQEVFLTFQQKSPELEDNNIRSWLFSVAQNFIYEEYRKQKKDINVLSYDDEAFSREEELIYEMDESDQIDGDNFENVKTKLFGLLTKEECELLKMIYIDKIKYEDIAEKLGTTKNVISVRAHRLRIKVKKLAAEVFVGIVLAIILFLL